MRDAFAANFAERDEIGASVAVAVRGEPVVNLWAGWADPGRTRAWQQDTLTNVWSTTKAMTSLCAHILIDRGELDPDAPVARYWPEFAAGGKSGHPGPADHEPPVRADRACWCRPRSSDYYDWDKITVAAGRPGAAVPAGQRQRVPGDHVRVPGRRGRPADHRAELRAGSSPREIAGPLGADFFIGLPEAELGRCSELQGVRPSEDEQAALAQAYASAAPRGAGRAAQPVADRRRG